jgi:hypothetical protein
MPSSQPLPTSPASHTWASLPQREQRGSRARCIRLTDGPDDVVAHRLSELVAPARIDPARHHWMPRGVAHPKEAKLGDALRFLSDDHRKAVTDWWLSARRGANTPNWDIASTATIDGKEGLVLVEAKAHAAELKADGKAVGLKTDGKAGEGTAKNHQHIDAACREASAALNDIVPGWNLSVAGHYQLCNRFAWAWRIAALGVPVVLVYLGFLRAAEMHDQGLPLADADSWERLLRAHSAGILPATAWDQPISIDGTPFRAVIRSMELPLDGVS